MIPCMAKTAKGTMYVVQMVPCPLARSSSAAITTVPWTYRLSTGWREWAHPNWTGPVRWKDTLLTEYTTPKARTSKAFRGSSSLALSG